MKKLVIFLILMITALIITACGDYYVNVDKDAVKLEIPKENIDLGGLFDE